MIIQTARQRISTRVIFLLWFGLLAGGMYCAQAVAGSSPSWLSVAPDLPREGRPIQAVITLDQTICLLLQMNPQNRRHDVRVINGDVVLDVVGEFGICTPAPSLPVEYRLPDLDAGEYHLIVNRVDDTTMFPASESDREFLGEMTFGVGPAPISIPVNHPMALVLLLLGMLTTAGWFLRR